MDLQAVALIALSLLILERLNAARDQGDVNAEIDKLTEHPADAAEDYGNWPED